jgi:hypothetical protein
VKEILKKLFRREYQSDPPSSIKRKFKKTYPNAINEEWIEDRDMWEVVFHDENREKIVRINHAGRILEHRINITPGELPQKILKFVSDKGELMNVILIDKVESTAWEIIYRDKKLDRYLMILDPEGMEISSRQL